MVDNIEKQIALSQKVIESLLLELKNNNYLKHKIPAESITKIANRIIEAVVKGGSFSVLKIILSEIIEEHYFSDKASAPSLFIDLVLTALTMKPSATISAHVEMKSRIVKFNRALKQLPNKSKEQAVESDKKNSKETKDLNAFKRGTSYRKSLIFVSILAFLFLAGFVLVAINKDTAYKAQTVHTEEFNHKEEEVKEKKEGGGIMTDSLRRDHASKVLTESSILNKIESQEDFAALVQRVSENKELAVIFCYLNNCPSCIKIRGQIESIGKTYCDSGYIKFYQICCNIGETLSEECRSFIKDGEVEKDLRFPTACLICKTSASYTGPVKSKWQEIITSSGCTYRHYIGSKLCELESKTNMTLGHTLELFLQKIHKQ